MATAQLNSTPQGSAVNLLRQTMMQSSSTSTTKPRPEDTPDSSAEPVSSPTPSGISTPQPDPKDKRLPSIAPSYFGQVGRPSSLSPLPATTPSMSSDVASDASSTTVVAGMPPSLPSPAESDPGDESALNWRASLHGPPADSRCAYPTPPMSSSSSGRSSALRSGVWLPASESGPTTMESSGLASAASLSDCHKPSISEDLAAAMRKHALSLSSKPLDSVLTASDVHAAHMSNPRLDSSADASIFSAEMEARVSQSRAEADDEDVQEGLTENSTAQNTPPRTPRSLSVSSRPSRTASPVSRPLQPSNLSTSSRNSSQQKDTADALVGEAKGRLSVYISEGRGLRPSHSPYLVCQFQSNEYISKGSRDEEKKNNGGTDTPTGAVPIQRSDSDMGRPMAIPMKSRQSSHTGVSSRNASQEKNGLTEPVWNHDAIFDVVGDESELDISVYDHAPGEAFLGHVRYSPKIAEENSDLDQWFKLGSRDGSDERVTGEIHLRIRYQRTDKKHYGPEDFQILKLIGKGTFGQVFQVRKKDTQRIYAMKVLSKKVIVQKKEVQHTIGERNILVRTAMTHSAFIVGLKFSFQTPSDLYLVTDYMSGGELFWHLQKEGRFEERRAKFYIAELILALQHLHQHDIVYRDLKPENILLDANGHIALCDFGLSKANLTKDDTTNTFCGTTEYLAPEVLLDEAGYTKMVDFWSLGVLVFEMCCGWSPFYAEDTQQMYKNIAFGKVRFPRDALSNEGRNFVKGLLNRNPKHRLGALNDAEELKAHPFFEDIDWEALSRKNLVPPFKPRLKGELDTSNFDPEFTNAMNGASSLNARAAALASGIDTAATPLSPTVQANFKGFTFVDESNVEKNLRRQDDDGDDVMDDGDEVPGWEYEQPANRMSGITRTVTGDREPEDGMFHGEGFEA